MGLFGKFLGKPDGALLVNGILGRGEIMSVLASSMTVRTNNRLVERKCTITASVLIDHTPPFSATFDQKIQEVLLPQLSQHAVVPVRVDPNDHSRVCIDFGAKVPVVTMARLTGENSGAWILEHGKPVKVVLVSNQPLMLKSADGIDLQLLTLTLYEGVDTPYQAQVANAVPATALPLLYPGSKLHAKLGNGPNHVVVDWAAGAAGPTG